MKSSAHLVVPAIAIALLARSVQGASEAPLPDGVSEAWVDRVTAELESRAYGFASDSAGTAAAANGAQRFEALVATGGVEVRADRHAVRLALRVVGFGREGALAPLPEGRVESRGPRAEIRRHGFDLVEWYENGPQGLEQGFDLATRPAGDASRRSVVLELEASGGLRPELRDKDQHVAFLDASGAERLRYGGLVAVDARGERVPSRLALAGDRVQIRVDDAAAAYPLVIDPLITTASWDPESNVSDSGFGGSVSTAGDFNGDGYSDLIIGAAGENLRRGRVYLFLGGAGGPDEVADSSFAGISANDLFGFSVAAAGDVNGDGFDDVVVGAIGDGFLPTSNPFGRIAVFLGNGNGLLENPQTTQNCFGATNPQLRDGLGFSVAGAGDVNMDGFDDVIAGGPELVIDLNRSGTACIYPGSGSGLNAAGVIRMNASSGITATVFQSHSFGTAVSGAGDVNGDGNADVVIGATGARGADNRSVGAAYVFHGPLVTGDAPEWAQLGDNRPLSPATASALFGGAVGDAGDLNGDGFADVIVGAPGYDFSSFGGSNEIGGVFIFHGSASGIATPVSDCDPFDFFTNVPAQYCEFGTAASARMGGVVATAGDLNGDGRADAMFSELVPNAQGGNGRANVVYGDASGTYVIALSFGAPANGSLASLATAGDPDRDGFSDIVLGVPDFSNGQTNEGRALLFRSTGDLPATAVSYGAEFGAPESLLGLGLSAGDLNGDGFTDIVAGAPGWDGNFLCGTFTDAGRFWVYYGGSCGPACPPTSIFPLCGWSGSNGSMFAQSVSTGDVNGDGFADVLAGAPGYDAFGIPSAIPDAGAASLYLGGSGGLSLSPAPFLAQGFEANAQFGVAVAIVGDVNGDGRADAVIGEAYSDETTGADAGSTHLYLGTPSGLSSSSAWDAIGSETSAQFGAAVAGAGDVNRDGYADVIVGAPGTAFGSGAAYVYLGGVMGLAKTPAATLFGGGEFGGSVATAGDVNGDGYSDVAVGALSESAVRIYTGPGLTLFDSAFGNFDSRFGSGVSTPGDVNGDGFSDLFVGAHWDDAGAGFAQGTGHLFLGSPAGIASVADRSWADCSHSFCDFGVRSAGAADVNGDGFGDVVTSAFKYSNGETNEGGIFVHFGNGGDGLERIPQQLTQTVVPIRPIGTASGGTFFRVWANGRSPAGRTSVRIETELEALTSGFDGLGTALGGYQDSGVSGLVLEATPQCTTSAPCKWRARVRSRNPHFPGSPWLSPPENARTEGDLRQFVDFDLDGTNDPADVCATIVDTGTDTDMDGVDNACDTCTNEVNSFFAGPVSKRIVVSGQLDDDADGRGNRCDFDYDNVGALVTAGDFNQIKASVGKLLFNATCGAAPTNNQFCPKFDHDEAGGVITASDFNLSKAAVGKVQSTQFPKCATCNPPFSRPTNDPLGPTLGKPICQAAPGVCPY